MKLTQTETYIERLKHEYMYIWLFKYVISSRQSSDIQVKSVKEYTQCE